MALRADWQAQLQRAHREIGFQYVRFHGLLSDDFRIVLRDRKKLFYFSSSTAIKSSTSCSRSA